jgi:hypothetical protein
LAQGATKIPVLVGSWTEEEKKILATLDPIAAMAEADPADLAALLAEVETESDAARSLLEELAAHNPPARIEFPLVRRLLPVETRSRR